MADDDGSDSEDDQDEANGEESEVDCQPPKRRRLVTQTSSKGDVDIREVFGINVRESKP